jgi:hypothetical protein
LLVTTPGPPDASTRNCAASAAPSLCARPMSAAYAAPTERRQPSNAAVEASCFWSCRAQETDRHDVSCRVLQLSQPSRWHVEGRMVMLSMANKTGFCSGRCMCAYSNAASPASVAG